MCVCVLNISLAIMLMRCMYMYDVHCVCHICMILWSFYECIAPFRFVMILYGEGGRILRMLLRVKES